MKFTYALAAAFAALSATSAGAADLLRPADPIYNSPLFNFEGLYVGVTGGVANIGTLYGTVGGVVGANFAITDGIIGGIEFQGDAYFNSGGVSAYDALAFGRVGGFISDNAMLYGELGGGVVGGTMVYAFGGGVEMALTDQLSVRGELQGIGAWGSTPSAGKATVGLLWHLN
jgi:outer membrane immunogenic protein